MWLTARFRRGRFASGRANFLVQSVFAGFVASPAGFAFRIWALVRVWIFTMLTVKVRPGVSVRLSRAGFRLTRTVSMPRVPYECVVSTL